MKKVDMYKILHKDNPNYGWGAVHLLPEIAIFIDFLKPQSVLDFGCGKGNLVKALGERYPDIKAYGYDPGMDGFDFMPVNRVDLVINTDVLEHIPENELPETIERISRLSNNVFFYLNHGKSETLLQDGSSVHCTVKPKEWYDALFRRYFDIVNFMPGVQSHNSTCVTFDIPKYIMKRYADYVHMHASCSSMAVKTNQLLGLLDVDFDGFRFDGTLMFYGYGHTSRSVYSKIKNKCTLTCFIDRAPCATEYDGVPILAPERVHEGGTIVVFPTYDFVAICAYLESNMGNHDIHVVRAEDFFHL